VDNNLQDLVDRLVAAAAALDPGANGGIAVVDMDEMARGLRLGSLHCARNELEVFLARLPRTHVVVLREDDWVLEHPLSCRRDAEGLTSCPFNEALTGVWVDQDVKPGRYEVYIDDGELVVGDPV
jgi:hypothetical protein